MQFFSLKTSVLKPNFNLLIEVENALRKNRLSLLERDILILTSKAVAVSEGRAIELKKIKPGKKAKSLKRSRYGGETEDPRMVELVMRESQAIMPGKMLLTLNRNALMPQAGIDISNAPKGFAVLLPKNPWKTSEKLLAELKKKFKIKKLGISIADSNCRPLRLGVTGFALAWAGFEGIEDARGQKDIYGKKLKFTRKAVADNLASAAALIMGEAAERMPFILVRSAPVKFTNKRQKTSEAFIGPDDCLFGGIYSKKALAIFRKNFC